jgi:LPXTG-motif cell wall-anchored protein
MKTKEERPGVLLRRIGAALVAMCVMSLSFVTGVFADTSSYAKTVTFSGMKPGDSITAYRLVSYNTSYNDYVFADKFGGFVDAKKANDNLSRTAYFKELTNAEAGTLISDYAAEVQTSESQYGSLADLESSTATATATATTAGETTTEPETTTETEPTAAPVTANATATLTLEPGYYMVLGSTTSTNSMLYSPTSVFVKLEGSNVKVYAGKSNTPLETNALNVVMKTEQAPTLDKMSKNPDHANETWSKSITSEVGDIVDFRIKVDIPAFNDGTELNLTIKDTMTNMTFVPNSVAVYSDEDLTSEINGAVPEKGVSVDEYNTTTHTQDLSIKLDFNKVHPTTNAQSIIYVYYKAVIHEDSSVDNVDAENVAKLEYSNKAMPDITFDTPDSKTDVDLFEIKLYKRDGNDNALAGAKFTLYEGTSTTAMKFSQKANGDYYPDTSGTITEVACDSAGYLHIVGLDEGTYKVQETTVPTGYYAPSDAFTLNLVKGSAKDTLSADSTSFTAVNSADDVLIDTTNTKIISETNSNGKANNVYQIYLKNSLTPILPTAGGMGTIIFTLIGLAMMTGACLIIFSRKNDTEVR